MWNKLTVVLAVVAMTGAAAAAGRCHAACADTCVPGGGGGPEACQSKSESSRCADGWLPVLGQAAGCMSSHTVTVTLALRTTACPTAATAPSLERWATSAVWSWASRAEGAAIPATTVHAVTTLCTAVGKSAVRVEVAVAVVGLSHWQAAVAHAALQDWSTVIANANPGVSVVHVTTEDGTACDQPHAAGSNARRLSNTAPATRGHHALANGAQGASPAFTIAVVASCAGALTSLLVMGVFALTRRGSGRRGALRLDPSTWSSYIVTRSDKAPRTPKCSPMALPVDTSDAFTSRRGLNSGRSRRRSPHRDGVSPSSPTGFA